MDRIKGRASDIPACANRNPYWVLFQLAGGTAGVPPGYAGRRDRRLTVGTGSNLQLTSILTGEPSDEFQPNRVKLTRN